MRRILAILPFVVEDTLVAAHQAALNAGISSDTIVTAIAIPSGPTPADYDRPGFTHAVQEISDLLASNQSDFDAAFISCFEDPGLEEARAISRIPVAGPLETAMALVRTLSEDFVLVSPDRDSEAGYRRAIAKLGADRHFKGFAAVDFEVGGANERAAAVDSIADGIARARSAGGADLAILACTDFSPYHADVSAQAGGRIIEPATTALRALEFILDRKSVV